jgi:hypothetical protein
MNFAAEAVDPSRTVLESSYHSTQESAARAACSRIPGRFQAECLAALTSSSLAASPRSGGSVSYGMEGYSITVTRK